MTIKFLTGYHAEYKSDVLHCCTKVVNRIAEISNPEEALLQLIEGVEEFSANNIFLSPIKPLYQINREFHKTKSIHWHGDSIQVSHT